MALPTVRSGAQALYPVTRSVEFATDIAYAANATEQRFKRRPPLTRFVLPYSRMNATDTTSMKSFFDSQKGTFSGSTFAFTLGAITYSNLVLEDDTFTAHEDNASKTTYSFTLKMRQLFNAGATAGSAGGAFPTLANGLRAQLPFSQMRRFWVAVNDNPTGMRFSYNFYDGGAGRPSRSLFGWQLEYSVLSDADLSTLETHFRAQWGAWSSFSFTDPDSGTTYTKCRYADDVLSIVYQGPNQASLTLRIIETN